MGPDALERAEALVAAEVDALVLDTAHGHPRAWSTMVRADSRAFDIDVVVGNIATTEAAEASSRLAPMRLKGGIGLLPGAGTRILMADSTYKNVEDVVAGDRVINMNGDPVAVHAAWCTGVREDRDQAHDFDRRDSRDPGPPFLHQ